MAVTIGLIGDGRLRHYLSGGGLGKPQCIQHQLYHPIILHTT